MSSSTETVRSFRPAQFGLAVEAEQVYSDARARGYAVGWAEGRRAAATEAEAVQERQRREDSQFRAQARSRVDSAITAAVEDWNRRTTPVLDDLADLVVDAALDLAAAIIGRELAASAAPERARLALRRALTPLTPGTPVRVRLNPSDLAYLEGESTTKAGSEVAHEGHLVELIADATLVSGDAVAEQDGATVDARVSAALTRARAVAQG